MERYQGKSIVKGMAAGNILSYRRDQCMVEKKYITNPEEEVRRYRHAEEKAVRELGLAYEKAVEIVGAKSAAIFEMQSILLKEGRFQEPVEMMIYKESVCPEYAVAEVGRLMAEDCRLRKEHWERDREADIREIVKRLLTNLEIREGVSVSGQEPVILLAKEVAPGELLQMESGKLIGLITELGTPESHTAVLAAAMQIPFVTGIPFRQMWDGKPAVVNGETGSVIIEPNMDELDQVATWQKKREAEKLRLENLTKKEDITLDGERMFVYANIGTLAEVDDAVRARAAGIGLFRSEFLYMGRENYPSEEEQYQCYRRIIEQMQGKPVVIRTLDIGADKQVDYFRLEEENNPAMGYRGIRICLDREELFRTQLKALYRAGLYGDLGVLYPMITAVEEVEKIQEIIRDIQEEMDAKKIAYGQIRQGVMIETPAAVMISDLLAEKVDFFSIGTNDLVQYIMAADRQNPKVAGLCDNRHPAVLRMIQMAVRNGHRFSIPVTICGEMAADLSMTQKLVEIGVDVLSVTPGQILPLRQAIRNTTIRSGQ